MKLPTVRNLGVTLDVRLTTNAYSKRVCQVSYFQLKTIRTNQNVLPPEALARLDDSNSIPIGIQYAAIQKLQLLQNPSAGLVSKTNRYTHITPVLNALY